MAESRLVDPFTDDTASESAKRAGYRRLSFLNGLLIGLALGLGAWGLEILRIARLPVESYVPALLLGTGLVILLGGLVGWITGRIANTPVTVVLWATAAVASMLLMGYLPYYGRTVATWLTDQRFWGREVFPYTLEGRPLGMVLGGLLIILTLVVLGLLQNYRMENIATEVSHRGRLNGRGWLSLLLPLPLVFLASMITQSVMANPSATSIGLIHKAISVAQTHEGDLRLLDLGDGISYAALAPVHDQIDGEFHLSLVDMNPLTSTVIVGADFDNGAWIYCRVINDQLSFCYDASPPYTTGLRSLVTGQPVPEDCRGCALAATEEAAAWLAERRDQWGSEPTIERAAQQGSHVLMRVTGDAGTAECWIEGVSPVRLIECKEVE